MDIVVQLFGDGVVEHAVDSEVAPEGILLGGAEDDGLRMAAIMRAGFLAKGGHFNGGFAIDDGNHAKGFSDRDGL